MLAYINSVVLFYNWKDTIPAFLERRLIEKKKTRALGPLEREFRSLLVINLSETEKWFDEIYEKDLFRRMVGAKRYKKFRVKFAELISNRNSIVHRGGENKKGDFIEIRLDELETLRLEANISAGNSLPLSSNGGLNNCSAIPNWHR